MTSRAPAIATLVFVVGVARPGMAQELSDARVVSHRIRAHATPPACTSCTSPTVTDPGSS
jgi:hypothetical protein